jgi:hypothetical protein
MCKCIRSSSDNGNRWTRDSETSVDIVDDCERQVASRLSVSGAQSTATNLLSKYVIPTHDNLLIHHTRYH